MPITIYYAAILALFYVYLTLKVVKVRKKEKIAIGYGESKELSRAIRVHANFAEYVPLALLLLYFLESQGGHSIIMFLLGGLLLIGRILHAYGVSKVEENLKFRVFGMFSTISVTVISALYILLIGSGIGFS